MASAIRSRRDDRRGLQHYRRNLFSNMTTLMAVGGDHPDPEWLT
jgi:hypothetical protein